MGGLARKKITILKNRHASVVGSSPSTASMLKSCRGNSISDLDVALVEYLPKDVFVSFKFKF